MGALTAQSAPAPGSDESQGMPSYRLETVGRLPKKSTVGTAVC